MAPAKWRELKKGDRMKMLKGRWIGAIGTVTDSGMMAMKSKHKPKPRAEQVWVLFDDPKIGFYQDIYDYQLEKI
jgi:hypothetical protein